MIIEEIMKEYRENLQVATNPKNPQALRNFLADLRESLKTSPGLAEEFPHYLALILHGQIRFAEEHPWMTWEEDLEAVTWEDLQPFIEATDTGREICKRFAGKEALTQAVLAIFLYGRK